MGLFGKLRSGLSSVSKHIKKRHFKMTAADLAENWEKLSSAIGDVYFSYKEHGEANEVKKVLKVGEGKWEKVEIWYYAENEENPGVYESEVDRVDPRTTIWIHITEAQYEKLVEEHGEFLKKFEA
ncbi:hypothetical protein [Pyrococcus abyssi]|uniref:Uncharacterized protein n=1 Tax=Pyrococcus abyssi (strain GE5 / Orsay) TaxID=272844 RepID=Q9V0Q5_PYRAB|nr:hypothetical protein [Pyrococcus abyssi]CAB49648.1 Hypothetical protein PAB1880 [Pyrococcus abyssi GE5]CCE70130.1 TPA: hypothetical protein PAB1880 [Pyrococcus abyssi GE5]